MRVLPGVVKQRWRRAAVACLIGVGAAALTGCAQFDKALGQREAVVSFRPDGRKQTISVTQSASETIVAFQSSDGTVQARFRRP